MAEQTSNTETTGDSSSGNGGGWSALNSTKDESASWDISNMAKELEAKLEEDMKEPTLSITELVSDMSDKTKTTAKDQSVYDFDDDIAEFMSPHSKSLPIASKSVKIKPLGINCRTPIIFKRRAPSPPPPPPKPKPDPRILKLDLTKDLYKEGYLVWAKVQGYSYWPGVVTVDPMDGLTVKFIEGKTKVAELPHSHIHFLGYDNQRAWLPDTAIMPYEGIERFNEMAIKLPKGSSKMKDFVPSSKALKNKFQKAIEVSEKVYPMGLKQRLEELGYIYVPIKKRRQSKIDSQSDLKDAHVADHSPKAPVAKKKSVKPKDMSPKETKASNGTASEENEKDETAKSSSKKKVAPSKKRKRAEPSTGSDSGVSSSIANSSIDSPVPGSKRRKLNKKKSKNVTVSSSFDGDEIKDISGEDEFASDPDDDPDEPKIGSLVWGRMKGFPYWPCFITKSPNTGEFKKEVGGKKKSWHYHAQFFNWNNESGWVTKTIPWCSKAVFKNKASEATKGLASSNAEFKAWHPSGRMVQKWEEAFTEANNTAKMTRKERHHLNVVFYHSKEEKNKLPSFAKNGPKKKAAPDPVVEGPKMSSTRIGSKKMLANEKNKSVENGETSLPTKLHIRLKLNKPGPLSSKTATARLAHQRKIDLFNARRRKEEEEEMKLPTGWQARIKTDAQGIESFEYTSSSGETYHSLNEAVSHLLGENVMMKKQVRKRSCSTGLMEERSSILTSYIDDGRGWFLTCSDNIRQKPTKIECLSAGILDGGVEYFRDGALSDSWAIKKSKRMPPKRPRRKSRRKGSVQKKLLASKLDSAGIDHPAIGVETLFMNYLPIIPTPKPAQVKSSMYDYEWIYTKDSVLGKPTKKTSPALTINLLEWSVEDAKRHPILGRAVVQCFVDMVHLPDVFLKHPAVKVVESENEMTISDLFTNEFIAKKIFYD